MIDARIKSNLIEKKDVCIESTDSLRFELILRTHLGIFLPLVEFLHFWRDVGCCNEMFPMCDT